MKAQQASTILLSQDFLKLNIIIPFEVPVNRQELQSKLTTLVANPNQENINL